MNRPLTNQQQSVYNFIRGKIVERGYGPTVREIGEFMNIKSPNGVMCHLRALERKGMLTRTANKSRAIELTEPVSRLMGGSLPIEGKIAGGVCTSTQDAKRSFDLGEIVAADRYILEVRDDSLLDAHIRSGDGLVVHKQNSATNGQLVVIRTSDFESSMRYFYAENGRYRLQPVNSAHAPTIVEHANVIGVVVGMVRMSI
jgi:repressor LexA